MSALPARADAVVIGGGVIGTSAAYHLAEAGVDTVLLERGSLGGGASAHTAGMVRTYFPGDPRAGHLAVRSLNAYHDFARHTAAPLALKRLGFLVLFTDAQQIADFETGHQAQRAAGVHVDLISAREASAVNPLVDERAVLAAAWSPEAYHVDGLDIVRGYAAAARNHGARLFTHTPVTRIDDDNTVHTPQGAVTADSVVCTAGPWSGEVASLASVDLPMTPHAIEMLFTDVPPAPRRDVPMTMHAASGLRIRSWKDRVLLAMGAPQADESREAWLGRIAGHLGSLFPALDGIGLHRAWSGDFDASPNNTAFIGEHPTRRFLYAAGFAGAGLCQAPAAGEKLRDLLIAK
ncbi:MULTISPECIES: NAD(P)/FAD-dependent oxidoreductase [unclassified Streptomyces]|uniref:NAD(P)/FAD-dependent oxidoreductase n=1 Tax=unclassified Streptomyces TaxID=2593676 RepID=UPI0022B63F32|nr:MULTISPECIES: FAD-dependent oxidoreductase [unclassified Streptomyces]MCZ7415394.1 FAD-dependent oxidoreductase [Streptomyces sp. WMMC897]MCZ7432323.1 FAD-dependent oxidoreductase [Streptomyces sp. WMMC1477]